MNRTSEHLCPAKGYYKKRLLGESAFPAARGQSLYLPKGYSSAAGSFNNPWHYLFLLPGLKRLPAKQARPEPSKSMVAGSGVGTGWGSVPVENDPAGKG